MAKTKIQKLILPKHEIEALAETLYPAIKEFYESEQGQMEFEHWKEQQDNIGTKKAHQSNNIREYTNYYELCLSLIVV